MEDKKFWIQLGQDFGETKQLSKSTNKRLENFISNDFKHLGETVDKIDNRVGKLSVKIAWIVGVISGLTLVGNVLLRVL